MKQTPFNPAAKAAYQLQNYTNHEPIVGVEIKNLKRFNDDGGSFIELSRLAQGLLQEFESFEAKQINYSEMDPGVIKAFHLHPHQTDVWFVPPSDKMLVILIDLRQGSATENQLMRLVTGDMKPYLLRIPPGVAHGVRNIASTQGRIIYFVDHQFDPDPAKSEEGRLPWDFKGAEIWEIQKG